MRNPEFLSLPSTFDRINKYADAHMHTHTHTRFASNQIYFVPESNDNYVKMYIGLSMIVYPL